MHQKLFLIVILFLNLQARSQNNSETEEVIDNSISAQLYTKCFENLNHGIEIFDKYPAFKNVKICSLLYCTLLYGYKEPEIKRVAEGLLVGIATQLYRQGTPVYLTMGMESNSYAQKKNENLEDDNHLVYISYAECTAPNFMREAAEIVNKQTSLLIYQGSR